MAVYQPKKVTAMPGSPTANTVYFVKNVGDSRIQMYVTDTSGTAFPVGILTENDVLGTSLAGFSTGSDIALSSSDTIIQAFQKVQGQLNALSTSVSQGMKVPLPLDCSTEPNYPAAEAGDSYKVTVAGKIGGASGPIVQVGDVITALTDNGGGTEAAVGTQWFILQANTDNATESVTGLTRIATQAEVNTGSEAFAYLTPLTLNGKLVSELAGYVDLTSSQTITGSKTFTGGLVDSVNGLGRTSLTLTTVTSGEWDKPVGNSTFVNGNTSTGLPVSNTNGYWYTLARRDAFGGYAGFWIGNTDEFFIGKGNTGTDNPTWTRLASREWVTAQNFQLSAKARKLDDTTLTAATVTSVNADDFRGYGDYYTNSNTGGSIGLPEDSQGLFSSTPTSSNGYFQTFHPLTGNDRFYFRFRSNGAAVQSWFQVASREWVNATFQTALTNPVIGTGVAGRIAYWSSTGVLTSNGGLLYDGSKLGLGFDTGIRGASGGLVISADVNSGNKIILRTDGDSDTTGQIEVLSNELRTSTGTFILRSNQGNGHIHLRPHGEGQVEVYSSIRIYRDGEPELRLGNNTGNAAPRILMVAAGSGGRTWTIQSGNSINGVNSSLSFSETSVPNLLVLANSARIGVNTDSPTDTLDVNGSARIRSMSIATGDHFVMATGTGVLRKITPATTLTLIGAQAARSITSSSSNIEISGGGAGSTSTDINVVWGAADW